MKDGREVDRHGTVVGVDIHDVGHEVPPLAADRRFGRGHPFRLVLDLDVAVENERLAVEEDRVVVSAAGLDHLLHLRPERVVALLVFLLHARMKLHSECLANHDFFSLLQNAAPVAQTKYAAV